MSIDRLKAIAQAGAEEYCSYLVWHWQTVRGRTPEGFLPVPLWARIYLTLTLPLGPASGIGMGIARCLHHTFNQPK